MQNVLLTCCSSQQRPKLVTATHGCAPLWQGDIDRPRQQAYNSTEQNPGHLQLIGPTIAHDNRVSVRTEPAMLVCLCALLTMPCTGLSYMQALCSKETHDLQPCCNHSAPTEPICSRHYQGPSISLHIQVGCHPPRQACGHTQQTHTSSILLQPSLTLTLLLSLSTQTHTNHSQSAVPVSRQQHGSSITCAPRTSTF